MRLRKISAAYIFSPERGFLKHAILSLSDDGSILSLEDTGGKLSEQAGLEYYNGIICPGFINAHCHLELSHMKGKIPRNTQIPGFVEEVINGRKEKQEVIAEAIIQADKEMKRQGIVAVGDICNTSDTFSVKAESSIYYYSFIELLGSSEIAANTIYTRGQFLVREAEHKYGLKASISPHSAYSLSPELFRLIREGSRDEDQILSVHNQESAAEDDLIRYGRGELYDTFNKLGFDCSSFIPRKKSSFDWLINQLPSGKNCLLIHNLYTTAEDLINPDLAKNNLYWVLCPKSNFYIGGIYPGTLLPERFPENICIGTDSLASNDKLSILEELLAFQNARPEVSLSNLLCWAGINGAKALGIDSWFGSFEEGKKPGVLLIENADLTSLKLRKESRVRVLV